MKHVSLFLAVSCSLLCLASLTLAQTKTINPREVLSQFQTIKPSPQAFPWKRIPWLPDLEKAMETARKEKRPMFLWGSDDNPLDRC